MSIKEILQSTHHRPWPLPAGSWKFYQEWNRAIFLHWQVDQKELRKYVPGALEIDCFEEKPWVSLVAFTMEKVRPRNFPAFSPISNFDEINIRTYVKQHNKAGVYFLSIEAGTKISCQLARGLSKLPYRFSRMERQDNSFQSKNTEHNDRFCLNYVIGKPVAVKSELDRWLTERYALFQDNKSLIYEYEIHHLEWPIFDVDLKQIEVHYPRFNNLLNNSPEKVHYSTGVKVMAWDKRNVK